MKLARYLAKLAERRSASRVYRTYQLTGLEIAKMLDDEAHKSLYIKLAKERNGDHLRTIAADVAERANVKNKGAYFMTLITRTAREKKSGKNVKKRMVKLLARHGRSRHSHAR